MTAFTSQTSPHPGGFNNCQLASTMALAGTPDPTYSHMDVEDFNKYLASDWTITASSSGGMAAEAGAGGLVLLSTAASNSDNVFVQRVYAGFTAPSGQQLFFKFSGKLSDATNSSFFCGLLETTTTPLAPTDGVYIAKATGQTGFTLNSMNGSVLTSVAFPAACVAVNATNFELGFMIDSSGNIGGFFNPLTGQQTFADPDVNQARGRCVSLYAPSLTTAVLNPSFGIQNGPASAAIKTLTVDYFVASRER